MRINVPESVRSKYTTIPMHKAPSYQDVKQDWTDWMKGIVWPGHITNKALILRDQDGNHYEFIPGELGEFDNQLNKLYDLIG
ncbi:hypothetical protein J2X61_005812 [Bacillus sp. 3255]|nr:hypothetical protein [Bacillus sp. 3255]